MTSEDRIHSGFRNVVSKITSNTDQNPQNQKTIFIPRRKSKTKKKTLFTSKLDLNLKKKLVKSHTWSTDLFVRCWNWILQKLNQKYLEIFEMCCCRRMEKIKWHRVYWENFWAHEIFLPRNTTFVSTRTHNQQPFNAKYINCYLQEYATDTGNSTARAYIPVNFILIFCSYS